MANVDDLESRLRALEDRQKIQEAIYRYCRGVDRCDVETFRSAFWPDGTYVSGPSAAPAAEFVEPLITQQVPQLFAASQHFMGNMIIHLDGDTATAETYAVGHHRSHPTRECNELMLGADYIKKLGGDPNGEYQIVIGFRYIDKLERRGDDWRILERRLVFDWNHAAPYIGIAQGGLYETSSLRGSHKPVDPLYSAIAASSVAI